MASIPNIRLLVRPSCFFHVPNLLSDQLILKGKETALSHFFPRRGREQLDPTIPLCVGVRGRDHLREVDEGWLVIGAQEDVELVEVTVDESTACQLHYYVHELTVEGCRIRDTMDMIAVYVCVCVCVCMCVCVCVCVCVCTQSNANF